MEHFGRFMLTMGYLVGILIVSPLGICSRQEAVVRLFGSFWAYGADHVIGVVWFIAIPAYGAIAIGRLAMATLRQVYAASCRRLRLSPTYQPSFPGADTFIRVRPNLF